MISVIPSPPSLRNFGINHSGMFHFHLYLQHQYLQKTLDQVSEVEKDFSRCLPSFSQLPLAFLQEPISQEIWKYVFHYLHNTSCRLKPCLHAGKYFQNFHLQRLLHLAVHATPTGIKKIYRLCSRCTPSAFFLHHYCAFQGALYFRTDSWVCKWCKMMSFPSKNLWHFPVVF